MITLGSLTGRQRWHLFFAALMTALRSPHAEVDLRRMLELVGDQIPGLTIGDLARFGPALDLFELEPRSPGSDERVVVWRAGLFGSEDYHARRVEAAVEAFLFAHPPPLSWGSQEAAVAAFWDFLVDNPAWGLADEGPIVVWQRLRRAGVLIRPLDTTEVP